MRSKGEKAGVVITENYTKLLYHQCWVNGLSRSCGGEAICVFVCVCVCARARARVSMCAQVCEEWVVWWGVCVCVCMCVCT